MTSLCRHLSVVSTGNCKLGHDCRRVCSHRRRDATQQFRLVSVGGVYWALISYCNAIRLYESITDHVVSRLRFFIVICTDSKLCNKFDVDDCVTFCCT